MNKEELLKTRIEVIKYLSDSYMLNVIVDVIDNNIELLQEYKQLEQENQQLKEEINELELIIGLRQKRNLIHKFDKEYDEEDKKKNPNRDYTIIMPDAEEVYKRYYEQQERINKAISYISEYCLYDEKSKDFNDDLDYYEVPKLLKILKGGD